MCIKDMFFISPFENGHKGTLYKYGLTATFFDNLDDFMVKKEKMFHVKHFNTKKECFM
jgi:hypothetical protein